MLIEAPPEGGTSRRGFVLRTLRHRPAAVIGTTILVLVAVGAILAPLIAPYGLHEQVRFVQKSIGAVPGPFDSFLVHRGLRTLAVRMRAHAESARAVSEWLSSADGAYDVRWPGFSGMVCFRHPEAAAIAEATKLFTLAESLGGVESLIEVPQAMTHQTVEDSAAAVPADLVRLSCGIEAPEDLVDDLARAFARVAEGAAALRA